MLTLNWVLKAELLYSNFPVFGVRSARKATPSLSFHVGVLCTFRDSMTGVSRFVRALAPFGHLFTSGASCVHVRRILTPENCLPSGAFLFRSDAEFKKISKLAFRNCVAQ